MNYSQLLLPALIVAIGSYYLFKIKGAYQDPRFMEKYIQNSHKALIWRKLFGVEKTINLTKKVFSQSESQLVLSLLF